MNSFLQKNKTVLLLYSLHLVLFTFLIFTKGFNFTGEGEKFFSEAQQLFSEKAKEIFQFQLLNLSYIFYLAVFIKLGFSKAAIILITHSVSLAAYYKFYSLLHLKFNNKLANWWLFFMLFCPLLLTWNLSLYSESFFIAIYLLFAYELFVGTIPLKRIFIYALLLLLSKPTGIIILLAFVTYKLHCTGKWGIKKTLFYYTTIGLALFLFVFFFVKLHFSGVANVILTGSVICGFPTNNTVYTPAELTLFNTYQLLFEKEGILEVFKLIGLKFISFFTLTRPYYSNFHNIINGAHIVFFVLNIMALWNSFKQKRMFHFNVLLFIQAIIIAHAFVVVLFFNEWTERYTAVIFPFLFLGSAYVIHGVKSSIKESAV